MNIGLAFEGALRRSNEEGVLSDEHHNDNYIIVYAQGYAKMASRYDYKACSDLVFLDNGAMLSVITSVNFNFGVKAGEYQY